MCKRCLTPPFALMLGSVVCGLILTVRLRMDTEHSAITEPVRRIEVFTGAGRRRTWSAEDKARIVAESVTSGESVCAVARRHGLSPQQLFGWRRQARQPRRRAARRGRSLFVPAVVDAPLLARAQSPSGTQAGAQS